MDTNRSEFLIKDNKLYGYLGNGEEMIIPEGVESVEVGDFRRSIKDIDYFKTVVIPGTLKKIPEQFLKETVIHQLIIKEGVESIDWNAFRSASIKKLELPNSVKVINEYAFYNCGLEEVDLNPTIERLSVGCFGYNQFSRFVYPKNLSFVDLNALMPTFYHPNKTLEIVCDFSRIERINCPIEPPLKSILHFSIIVSDCFSFNKMCSFLENIKNNNYNISIQKIVLIGYSNFFYLSLLKQLAKQMEIKIEIEMVKEMDEDLKRKVVGGVEESREEETIVLKSTDQEIESLVKSIIEKSSVLEESLREKVISQVNNLIQKYQKDVKELKPKFEIEESTLALYQTPQSLRLALISKLQGINMNFINLDADIYLKKKIEKYKELVNESSTIEHLEQVESIEDKIQVIKYYASLLNQEDIKDEILIILTEIENHLLIPSLDTITLSMNRNSINYEQELKCKIDDLYQKVKESYQFYQSLCGKNDTSLGSDMKSLNEILNYLDERSKSTYRERVNQIKNKYLMKIKELKIENDSELKVRQELAPILEDLQKLIPNMKGKKRVLADMDEARELITRKNRKKLDLLNELNMILLPIEFGNNTLDEIFKNKVGLLFQKLEDIDNDFLLKEKNQMEPIRSIFIDIQSLLIGNEYLLRSNMSDELSSYLISKRLKKIINDYCNSINDNSSSVEIDKEKMGAVTSTVHDILSSLENPVFDEGVKNQIKTSLRHILNDSYEQVMDGSLVIEEREDSVTKNLDWSSKITLQILRKFHVIQNFIDRTLKYNEEIGKLNFSSNHKK